MLYSGVGFLQYSCIKLYHRLNPARAYPVAASM